MGGDVRQGMVVGGEGGERSLMDLLFQNEY